MIGVKVRGAEEFKSYIDSLARNSRGIATEEITKYLIGNDQRGFKHYPAPRGQKYKRTYTLQRGWIMTGARTTSRAVNSVSYAPYVQGTGTQVWWTKPYNWRNIYEITLTNIKGACRAAEQAIIRNKK